jgi:hypothetical protein
MCEPELKIEQVDLSVVAYSSEPCLPRVRSTLICYYRVFQPKTVIDNQNLKSSGMTGPYCFALLPVSQPHMVPYQAITDGPMSEYRYSTAQEQFLH